MEAVETEGHAEGVATAPAFLSGGPPSVIPGGGLAEGGEARVWAQVAAAEAAEALVTAHGLARVDNAAAPGTNTGGGSSLPPKVPKVASKGVPPPARKPTDLLGREKLWDAEAHAWRVDRSAQRVSGAASSTSVFATRPAALSPAGEASGCSPPVSLAPPSASLVQFRSGLVQGKRRQSADIKGDVCSSTLNRFPDTWHSGRACAFKNLVKSGVCHGFESHLKGALCA